MKANSYLYQKIRQIDHDEMRPLDHFTAPVGWINDPNGLIYYKNYYHLFYQYNPYAPHWDAMHWGHARSKDGLHWQDLPIAMSPDHEYDKDGVFSGSAIIKDKKLYVIYTGHVIDSNNQAIETQNLAWSDNGIDFHKYEKNPVITVAELPAKADQSNFRDPKVFKHGDKYYCILAAAIAGEGSLVLFESENLFDWSFKSVLLHNSNLGIMTECPDYANIDGKDFLLFSVIKGNNQKSIVYTAQGKMNWENFTFALEKMKRLDDGYDFYASQSFLNKKGRRTVIPWLRSAGHINYLEEHHHLWNGMMGIPRELYFVNNRLVQRPIGEVKTLDCKEKKNILLGSYRLKEKIKIGQCLLLAGANGEIRIGRKDTTQYLIEIRSPAFIKKIFWTSKSADLIIVIDNSSLELFAENNTLSVVTFIYGIKKAILKKISPSFKVI